MLGSPPAASARGGVSFQPFFEYKIVFTGKGSYNRSVTNSESPEVLKEEASWTWNTIYPDVLVPTVASSPLSGSGFPAFGLGQEADGKWSITNTGSEGEDCSHSGTLGLPKQGDGSGGGGVTVKRPAGGSKGVIFIMNALDTYETTSGAGNGALACEPEDWWHDIIESFAGVGTKHTEAGLPEVRPLTAKIQLAPSELKHGSVTKHVSVGPSETVPSDCGSGSGITCTQAYTWSGTVTFTKHKFKKGKGPAG
ncbi:MAG: hypothetical protein ABSB69_08640 [Solirubrobacteraceae bacterium]